MKVMLLSTIRKKDTQVRKAIDSIIETLQKDNLKVYHEHITQVSQDDLDKMSDSEDLKFHNKLLSRLKKSDIVVAESSNQSLSVGYLVSRAIELGKPTIICYNKEYSEPNLFPTLTKTDKLFLVKYSDFKNLQELLKENLDYAKEQQDVRFNFFISPEIANYLDWISKEKKIPRSVYLRNLIEEEMESNEEYNI